MDPLKKLQDVMERCALACEQESVAQGFSPQLGRDIYNGCLADDLDNWSDEHFTIWIKRMEAKYLPVGIDKDTFMGLYGKCSEIMASYAPVIEAL